MTPIVFGGRFGWLHAGQGNHGVVMCNPFGHEEAWGHKAMRYLAEELARRDIPVLRFDYLATGDSAGIDHESDRLDQFVADIGAAVERLRHETGVTKVTLCGLRLGGTLAALASHHPLVDSLALLAPVVNGRHYMRELTALRQTWVENLPVVVRAAQIDSPYHVLGQVYSEALRGRLSGLDLAKSMIRQPAVPKRMFVADLRPGASQSLCNVLRDRGVEVQAEAFDDYFDFMQETASSVLPEKTLKRTAQWIAEGTAEGVAGDLKPGRARKAARPNMSDDAIIETPEAIERPVIFGATGLFGILCEPRDGMPGGPVIVITNTAGSVHQGDSRLSVRFAREMAQRGIASLRFDARGIGDSPARSEDGAHDKVASIHADTTVEDVATAAAWLKRKGYDNVVVFGICSGAYSAVRASLIEPAIGAAIAVNLQRFHIPEHLTLHELRAQRRNTMARLGPAILKPQKWWLVLSGQRGLKPILKAFASNAAARLQSQMRGVARKKVVHAGQSKLTDPHSVVHTLERKGVRTLLVYGAGDEGLDQLNAHFGRHGKKLSRTMRVRAAVCGDVDHALYDTRALASVIALAETFIKDLQPDPAPVIEPIAPLGVSPQL
ncbi:alpha/beta hydrolase [Caballeronia temeraria]|uniref:Alpha/beta hydrolase n=1 Tax=Caballeronia temeraria TaxID=1777137 RepID=A0A158CP02_9BURK|nr:alpha/beta fold hydrolase [Caballeronia temeraria]SAK83576.1 alpha/beta hydrolase [Caballeronia temeraria]